MTKSNLERLVPGRELCEKIPPNEFDGSVLAWLYHIPTSQYIVAPRSINRPDGIILTAPAPTLEEIMDELVCRTNEPCVQWNGGWYVSGDRLNGKGRPEAHNPVSSVTAALRLWLKVEGIE